LIEFWFENPHTEMISLALTRHCIPLNYIANIIFSGNAITTLHIAVHWGTYLEYGYKYLYAIIPKKSANHLAHKTKTGQTSLPG